MYKILIVDDEMWIRKGIIAKLKYHNLKFTKILEAENGQQALKVIEAENPNIIITDIKMPIVDGLELIRLTQIINKEIKFLIISGYSDFAYAKQAINMGVSGYILKPIRDNNFINGIQKVISELDTKNNLKRIIDNNQKLEQVNQYLLVEQKLNQILYTAESTMKYDIDIFKMLKINDNSNFLVALINIDTINFTQFGFNENDIDLIKSSIKNIFEESNKDCQFFIVNSYKNKNQMLLLFTNHNKQQLARESKMIIYAVLNKIKNLLHLSITIGISKIEQQLSSHLNKQANKALISRLIRGNNRIYHFSDIEKEENYVTFQKEKLKLLSSYIENYDINNIEIILQEIFNYNKFKKANWVDIRYVWLEVANVIIMTCSKLNLKNIKNIEVALISDGILERFDDFSGVTNYLYTTIIDVLKFEKSVNVDGKDIIIKAQEYFDKHYDQDITVKELAYKLALNPNYLSTLFKKMVGKSITTYVKEKRIENACKLLEETQASVAEISQIVGYQDPQYFYRVFKKSIGMTPLSYRNKLDKEMFEKL